MIDVSELSKSFGGHQAVDDITFRLERGEVVGFLGPNGAGKTTTMRMLTGYLPPTRGTIAVGGFDVLRQSMEVRRRIGYLPENVPLYRELRVEEMLEFHGRLHGLGRKDRKARAGEVLERVALTDRRRSRIGDLSRGLRQRAGLAVALLPRPEVLILDEPTSGLDPLQRIEVRNLIRELTKDHTVLLSSHILAEVEAVAPRVIILQRGKIAADGEPGELVRELGGGSKVRLEAVVGDAAAAAELIGSLPGVDRVVDDGRVGIHHQFDVFGTEDLREDLGALAAAKGWALRELSWRRPTLEEIFARIALELDSEDAAPVALEAPATAEAGPSESTPVVLESSLPISQPAAPADAPKPVYNLNPFDRGASRDLGAPIGTSEDAPSAGPAKTLNPFENFGSGGAASAEPAEDGDEGDDGKGEAE